LIQYFHKYLVTIREIEYEDIDKGFLEVLDNLLSSGIDHKLAKDILKEIKSNPFHKIFIAKDDTTDEIIGTTTLLVEPKFINKGMKVGYIEDVSVKKAYEGTGIGSQIVKYVTNEAKTVHNCAKVLLYCSDKNKKFYEKLGYKIADKTFVMMHEF
jgi:glucosamine-phosphate N-acetyltransferase